MLRPVRGTGHRGEGWHEVTLGACRRDPAQTRQSLDMAMRSRYPEGAANNRRGVAVRKRGIKADTVGWVVEPFPEIVMSRFGGKNPDWDTLSLMCLRNTRGDID